MSATSPALITRWQTGYLTYIFPGDISLAKASAPEMKNFGSDTPPRMQSVPLPLAEIYRKGIPNQTFHNISDGTVSEIYTVSLTQQPTVRTVSIYFCYRMNCDVTTETNDCIHCQSSKVKGRTKSALALFPFLDP